MQRYFLFITLIFLTACTADQPASLKPLATLSTDPDSTAPQEAYPPPTAVLLTPSAYPVLQLTVPQAVTPLSTATETAIPIEPTLPPLMPHIELESVTLFDENTGWAVQSFLTPSSAGRYYDVERKVFHASQGFAKWLDVSPLPFQEKAELRKVFFLNANTAVTIFYRNFMPYQADTELTGVRTEDGGRTWQVGEIIHFNCCLRNVAQLDMLDADHGWMMAVSDGAMGQIPISFFRTFDGGLHWEKAYDSDEQFQVDPVNALFGGGNAFGNHGFALVDFDTALYANGWLYRSEDGGKSWQQVTLPIPPAQSDLELQAGMGKYAPVAAVPQMWSRNDGVFVGRYYNNLQIPPGSPTEIPVAEFLFYTHDGGKTWTYSRSPARTGHPFFLDSNTGWYLGKSDPDPEASTQLYQTTDGGQTWSQILSDCPLPLGSVIRFLNPQMGYASVTSYSYDYLFDARADKRLPFFFFTHDGGHTWEQVERKGTQ